MKNKRDNNELVMETTYGRGKAKTEFKAVINKVLAGALALSALMGASSLPAFASENVTPLADTIGTVEITQDTVTSIRNTIQAIQAMKTTGSVSDALINQLASEVYALQNNYNEGTSINEIANILDDAESAVSGLSNAGKAMSAIVAVRTMLGLADTHAVEQAEGAPLASSFSDVNQGDWFYDNVMAMTGQGLFAGYDDGTFKPGNNMTKAEFLAVVCRILELDTTPPDGGEWYSGVYNSALEKGLVNEVEFRYSELGKDISRQEMAMVSIRAMEILGENVYSKYSSNVKAAIPDFNQVNGYFSDYVVRAYEKGIITGGTNGEFMPTDSTQRCQAAAVLNRIMDTSARVEKDFSQAPDKPDLSGPIIIYENQPRDNSRLAREGDTVIKEDGSSVVLKIDAVTGVLGFNQGVAPDVGIMDEVGMGDQKTYQPLRANGRLSTNKYGLDSVGKSTCDVQYWVNPLTGEGHWAGEWTVIGQYTRPKIEGVELGDVSEDQNYIWDGMEWILLSSGNGHKILEYVNNQ